MKLSDAQLKVALKYYGLSFARLDFVQSGYRNTSHIVETSTGLLCNLLVYKREEAIVERIQRINALSSHLHDSGLPVRYPLDDRILRLKGVSRERYASLYSFEHGATIAWEMYSMKHIKLLGMAMGQLHDSARDYKGNLPRVSDEYSLIFDRIARYFENPNISQAMRSKLSISLSVSSHEFARLLYETDLLAGQQPLHLDFVRGNVLFRQAESIDTVVVDGLALSGILDLEKAATGHPIYDLARTYAFLLVDCNKPAKKIYKYFLSSGYVKRGGGKAQLFASGPVSTLFEQLITLFLYYDFYKFLYQNPYESLTENHHYMRTCALLVERGVLKEHSK